MTRQQLGWFVRKASGPAVRDEMVAPPADSRHHPPATPQHSTATTANPHFAGFPFSLHRHQPTDLRALLFHATVVTAQSQVTNARDDTSSPLWCMKFYLFRRAGQIRPGRCCRARSDRLRTHRATRVAIFKPRHQSRVAIFNSNFHCQSGAENSRKAFELKPKTLGAQIRTRPSPKDDAKGPKIGLELATSGWRFVFVRSARSRDLGRDTFSILRPIPNFAGHMTALPWSRDPLRNFS